MSLKVVIDTNVYISAIFWGGKPRDIVDMGRYGKITIFSSSEIEQEIILKLKTKFKLNGPEIDYIISDFATFTNPVKITKSLNVVVDDPDDNKFIECAIACGANYIITGDKHLLRIEKYEGIQIVKAADFMTTVWQ